MTRCYEHKFRSDQLRAVCKSWESVDNEVVVEIHPRPVSIESTVDSEKNDLRMRSNVEEKSQCTSCDRTPPRQRLRRLNVKASSHLANVHGPILKWRARYCRLHCVLQ